MPDLQESELLVFRAKTPADRRRLRDAINVNQRLERLSASRVVLVGVLLLLGVPLWILSVWPQAMPRWHMLFVLGWPSAALGLAVVTIAESAGRRRLRQLAKRPISDDAALQAATPPCD